MSDVPEKPCSSSAAEEAKVEEASSSSTTETKVEEKTPTPTTEVKSTRDASTSTTESKIEEACNMFRDPYVDIRLKIAKVLTIPQSVEISKLTQTDCANLFTDLPIEVLDCVLNSGDREYEDAKPIVIQILSFCCQCTRANVFKKFKPLVKDVIKLAVPPCKLTTANINDISIIVSMMPIDRIEMKLLYDSLRYATSFFVAQKANLQVQAFLSVSRLILSKIFSLIRVGEDASSIDAIGWSVGSLSILRNMIRQGPDKLEESIRIGMWDVIGSVARLIGPKWFSLDETFAKLCAQLNTVELRLSLHNAEQIVPSIFTRHLRILEVFVCACHDDEIFTSTQSFNDILLAVGGGVKLVLEFWYEADTLKLELPAEITMNLFNFSVFLLSRGELEIIDEKVMRRLGPLILTQAEKTLEVADMETMSPEFTPLFSIFFEKVSEITVLDERVAEMFANYIVKLRSGIARPMWKSVVIELSLNVLELRGRVDWYSYKTIENALKIFNTLDDDDKPDVQSIIKFFEKLPRVK